MAVCDRSMRLKISGYLERYAFGIKLCLSRGFNIPDFCVTSVNLTISMVRSRGYGSLRALNLAISIGEKSGLIFSTNTKIDVK
ncbi:hypothetical protein [Brunnivagina elsteri]|uniref:hypothetical protein n=1 Tax=Brunnivagina elsteri TaxID=1247191 RepID=UPI001178021F|nr:hypothetical protein [Calothrix elsteri]